MWRSIRSARTAPAIWWIEALARSAATSDCNRLVIERDEIRDAADRTTLMDFMRTESGVTMSSSTA